MVVVVRGWCTRGLRPRARALLFQGGGESGGRLAVVRLGRDCTPVAAGCRTEQLCGAHCRGRRAEGGVTLPAGNDAAH